MKSDGGQKQPVRELTLFDPRSRRLNTEMEQLIDSTRIARDISEWLDENLPTLSYRVSLDGNKDLLWTGQDLAGHVTVFNVEPNTTLLLRLLISA